MSPALKAAPVLCRLVLKDTENILPGTDSVQTVLKTERPSSPERRYQTCEFPAVESTGILEPLKFLAFTELYEALLTNAGSGVPTGIPS
jgi:hypothetical protein